MTGFEQFFSFIKLKTRHFVIVALIGTLILFLPDTISKSFRLDLITDGWRFTIGIITLASYAGVTVYFFIWAYGGVSTAFKKRKYREAILARLSSLSAHEMAILKECHDRGQQTITIHMLANAYPYAGALCSKGLLAQTLGAPGTYVVPTNETPYTIPDFVWNSEEFKVLFSGAG